MRSATRLLRPAGRTDDASLEERFGLLAVLRLGMAGALLLGAVIAPSQVGLTVAQVALPSAVYASLAVAVTVLGTRSRRAALRAHRIMLPLDTVWLVLVTAPSGGARSQLLVLFYLHLVAAALLASARSALRIAVWDAILFVAVPTLGLAPRIGELLGARVVVVPGTTATAVAVTGFWAVALCTVGFSRVNERELRRHRRELEALAAMASALEEAKDLETARRVLLSHTATALGVRRAALEVPGGTDLVLSGGEAVPTSTALDGLRSRAGGAVDEARRMRRPLARRRLDPATDPVAAALIPGARNLVVAPVGQGPDAPMLLLEHGGRAEGERVARRTLLVVGQFASHAALALGTTALLVERERQAAMDGLTGLANRRHFDRSLTREVASARRRHEPLSLVLVDVDHFKRVNDTRGHQAGDEVLRALADALQAASRDMDLAARFGGEEFVLLLPSCRSAEALGVLRRLDAAMAADPRLAGITVSSGVATLLEHADDGEGLVAAADEALYASKRAGRNRATVSSRQSDAAVAHPT